MTLTGDILDNKLEYMHAFAIVNRASSYVATVTFKVEVLPDTARDRVGTKSGTKSGTSFRTKFWRRSSRLASSRCDMRTIP